MTTHARPLPAGSLGRGEEPDIAAYLERSNSSRFVVDGHSFIAIPQSPRPQERRGDPFEIASDALVVGRIACSGRRYLVYDAKHAIAASRNAGPSVAEILTKRELQVALLIGEGKCDKEIARHLGISGYTVREHIRRIFAKLNIGRRSAIVARVLR
jgi:DNA-binding CsgD family transcriptional regulator